MPGFRKEVVIVCIGAVVGSAITFFVNSWSDSEERLNLAMLKEVITEVKNETLDVVQVLIHQVGRQQGKLAARQKYPDFLEMG